MSKPKNQSSKSAMVSSAWNLTAKDVRSINKLEVIWGTTKFLPPEDQIPPDFYKGNIYTQLADAMWCGEPKPNGEVTINDEFQELQFTDIQNVIMAHLKSFEPKHEHKIAGVGYMISKIVHITAILT